MYRILENDLVLATLCECANPADMLVISLCCTRTHAISSKIRRNIIYALRRERRESILQLYFTEEIHEYMIAYDLSDMYTSFIDTNTLSSMVRLIADDLLPALHKVVIYMAHIWTVIYKPESLFTKAILETSQDNRRSLCTAMVEKLPDMRRDILRNRDVPSYMKLIFSLFIREAKPMYITSIRNILS